MNEYTERREMSAEVSCLSLAAVPPGEQRSRFLAVGLADQTVRIISLDPTVSVCCVCVAVRVLCGVSVSVHMWCVYAAYFNIHYRTVYSR